MSGASVQVVRVTETPPEGFEDLRLEAVGEGYVFLDRLADEIARGDYADADCDLPVLFGVFADGQLVGLGALTADPYDPAPDLARLRHVYVRRDHRGRGVGRVIASALIQQGLSVASRLSLRAADPAASAFWTAQGFRPDDSDAQRTHLLTR
ncbi:GNAT family N-acetyltransferase [Bosea sp. PAMC 26642]|uniref:GNAT family N-acetyltransferase n=1 Tax=Bosea sp. (strain PAMC 26642) TaxID=1792307 RepID=UPI000770583F|nr:GNAT family N-acetyltransferase [Bosea sp. PAMC 26642]AMJ62312.1 hypothetical protein AXW83_20200 [Bosea sp. PAMC 26642]